MPNGVTHRKITMAMLIATPLSLAMIDIPNAAWLASGVAVTLYVNPDLDLYNPMGGAGKIIGMDAYKRLIPHRAGLRAKSWRNPWQILMFSHVPFIGTLLRFVILSAPIAVALLIIGITPPITMLWMFVGMGLSDTAHVIADVTVSAAKKSNSDRARYYYHKNRRRR